MDHRVLGVIGASGGLGVSTLVVALAVRAAGRVGATVAVDGAPGGGALDVTACVEHVSGLRWADLGAAEGRIDGAALLRELPAEGPTRVLAGRGPAPPDAVVRAALSGLSEVCGLGVVDLGGSTRWAELCTDLLLVVGSTARQLADGAGVACVRRCLRPWTVARRGEALCCPAGNDRHLFRCSAGEPQRQGGDQIRRLQGERQC